MTLHLVRHASAGSRDWSDPRDSQRHLDEKGLRQAAAIARHLATEPVEAVYSSPFPRCVETVLPLTEQLGTAVIVDDRLAEGTPVEEAWSLFEEVADRTVVLCSHGDVIPDLINRDRRRGMRVREPTGFSKGSVWELRDWNGTHHSKGFWNRLR